MTALVVRDEVVLFAEAREDAVPHLLVRHERVDKDEPRRVVVVDALGDLDVQLDSFLDLDIVLGLLRLGQGDADVAHVANVERDEQARDHVVRRGDGRHFEQLLVVLEELLELVKARLRHLDVVGRSVGEAERGGLEGREDARCGRRRQRRVQVTDDGQLLSRESGIDPDVRMVCRVGG